VPSELMPLMDQSVLVAAGLIFIARPLAVAMCLAPFRFPWRHLVFISWVGIRGAVPIVLSLFPLLAGVAFADQAFNIIFFVVLLSLTLQGWTVGPLARYLGLLLPRKQADTSRVDLDVPPDHELVVCRLPAGCPATSSRVSDLVPPDGVRLISMVREGEPRSTAPALVLAAGDALYLVVPTGNSAAQERFEHWLDAIATTHPRAEQSYFGEFALDGAAPMADFAGVYLNRSPEDLRDGESLGAYLRRNLRHRASEGDQIRVQGVVLVVREIDGGHITRAGVRLPRDAVPA